MRLRDLKDGDKATIRCACVAVEEKEGAHGPYVTAMFADGDSKIVANIWKPLSEFPFLGKVVTAEFSMKNGFRNAKDVREAQGGDPLEFVPREDADPVAMTKYVKDEIAKIADPDLRAIASTLITENEEAFSRIAGGQHMHHSKIGGLAYHSARMVAAAAALARVYNKLDPDLMRAGAALHDIGKVREMSTDVLGETTYTTDGNLFGHLFIGAVMVDEACAKLGIDPNKEKVKMLKHMIVSHHGAGDKGAIRVPMIKEAMTLWMIDTIDSRMWMYEEEEKSLEPGESMPRKHKSLDCYVYRMLEED